MHAYFEDDERLQRWLNGLALGSPITAETARRRLGKLCELLSATPQELLESAKKDLNAFQKTLEVLVTRLEDEKKSPSSIVGILGAVRILAKI